MVSDPKACNNIFIKDQAIFEETEAFLEYVYSFQSTPLLTPFPVERTSRSLDPRSFQHWVGGRVTQPCVFLNSILR